MRHRGAIFAFSLSLIVSNEAVGQEAKDSSIQSVGFVVLEGPFELTGGGGVLGYVLKRIGSEVSFQPCTGPVLTVDNSRLRDTLLDCRDEPQTDPHPFNVTCHEVASKVAAMAQMKGEDPANAPVGTTYTGVNGALETLPTAAGVWEAWTTSAASPFAVCDDKYLYFPEVQIDKTWIGIVKNAPK